MTKKHWWVIIGISVCFLIFIFSFRIISKSYLQATFIREFSRYPGAKDFLKNNPEFIKSVTDYPEILTILKNGLDYFPEESIEFLFQHHKKFIEDLKNNPEIRKTILNLSSSCPPTMELFLRDYNASLSFFKKLPQGGKFLVKNPDFAHYLAEHPDKLKILFTSPELERTGREIYEEFIIEKYLKYNEIKK